MTPYERGYAAALKAAAALVPTDEARELCCNGYDCECRKHEDAAFVAAEIEARRVKKAILSLPIQGEATNPVEQVPDSARIGSEPHVTTPARPGPSQKCVSNLSERLRQYADIADAGGKAHWANAMREAMYTLAVYRQNAAKEEHDAHR